MKIDKMTTREKEYGIFIHNDLLKDLSKVPQQRTALLGQVVIIDDKLPGRNLAVRYLKDAETWESVQFCCSEDRIVRISEKLWPFIASITSPQERIKLAKNKELCKRLRHICKDMVVGFSGNDDIYLGKVKYIGHVKGMGYGYGIALHERRKGNHCNGSCAGIQYFTCLPGYGVFTTIEKIAIPNSLNNCSNHSTESLETANTFSDLDYHIDKNLSSIGQNVNDSKPKNEEIVTRYGEYPKKLTMPSKSTPSMRNSLSLQNMLDIGGTTINTNNDFDQNSVIQPERTYLMAETKKAKNKSEVDLIDVIGTWSGTTDEKNLEEFSNFKKNLDKNDNIKAKYSTLEANTTNTLGRRNRSVNPLSHFIDGSGTLKKSTAKFYTNHDSQECKVVNKVSSKSQITNKHAAWNSVDKFLRNSPSSKKCARSASRPAIMSRQPVDAVYANEDVLLNLPLSVLEINEKNARSTFYLEEKPRYRDPPPEATHGLAVGSLVEVANDVSEKPLYGVVRWMGVEAGGSHVLVGVELEEEHPHLPLELNDGVHKGERLFRCADNRAVFVGLEQCRRDSRFQDGAGCVASEASGPETMIDCPVIPGALVPLCMPTEEDVEAVCGKFRGIQGHHNSCYLDVTLFSMFTYTSVFDSLLFRPKEKSDIGDYEEVQRVLREEIVNPLRKNLFVSADNVMKLRRLLDRLSSVSGLTSEEKDPEEFLNSLLAQILRAEPFLKLNSGQESFHYQLFVEKDADLTLPTVQQLFEQSFLTSDIKLKEVPSCLIVQMPRFGKSYKMYPRILPSQLLDVTDVIEGSPRQCIVCGKLARYECKECFDDCSNAGLESTAFCFECLKTAHRHEKRANHRPTKLEVAPDFSQMQVAYRPPRLYMELFAVICIETSHYVAFVKCGVGHEAPWCFFDSMADRKGERNGYNIPEMVACPDISRWLSDDRICRQMHEEFPVDRHLPEHARRLLCDAYICMYQSPDVMMYR